jgi:hypothetical protein
MAEITRFQLNEIKREVWFQLGRIDRDLAISTRQPPGMLKSRRRLLFLLSVLKQLEQDGVLHLKEDGGDGYEDGTNEDLSTEREIRLNSERF